MRMVKQIGLVVVLALGLVAVLSFFPWGPVKVVRVVGKSMEPTLHSGDWLLFARTKWGLGDIVLAQASDGILVKRVIALNPHNRPLLSPTGKVLRGPTQECVLWGDNFENSDGCYVYAEAIRGKLIARLTPYG